MTTLIRITIPISPISVPIMNWSHITNKNIVLIKTGLEFAEDVLVMSSVLALLLYTGLVSAIVHSNHELKEEKSM